MHLSAEHLGVRFESIQVLADVTCAFAPGSRTLVVGRSGAGKTSLLKALAGLRPAAQGRVLWDGEPVGHLEPRVRRARQAAFGMVFQSDALFDSSTVRENVLLPLLRRGMSAREAERRTREVLDAVGLGDAAQTLPEQLSGGMRKRAGLARALVAAPAVLLADDPFAGLDPGTARTVGELFAKVSPGSTLIVAAAEPPEALEFDRWLVLRAGRLVHDGPPAPDLLAPPDEVLA